MRRGLPTMQADSIIGQLLSHHLIRSYITQAERFGWNRTFGMLRYIIELIRQSMLYSLVDLHTLACLQVSTRDLRIALDED